jgi:hypothetical protein
MPFLHVAVQVPVRRAQDADVDRDHAVVPQAAHLPLLQDAEQPPLQAQGDLGYLVEEDRASVRSSNSPGLPFLRAP